MFFRFRPPWVSAFFFGSGIFFSETFPGSEAGHLSIFEASRLWDIIMRENSLFSGDSWMCPGTQRTPSLESPIKAFLLMAEIPNNHLGWC